VVVVNAGYDAAFLVLAVAGLGLMLYLFAMPEPGRSISPGRPSRR
jgi:hypothetical protein